MIIGKINDKVLIDDAVLREPEILTRWQDPTIDKYKQALLDIKEYIEKNIQVFAFGQTGNVDLAHWEFDDDNVRYILDIVNKAIGSDE